MQPPHREYPHIVSKGPRRNGRTSVLVSNEPVDAYGFIDEYVFIGQGFAKSDGSPTELARAEILKRICDRATHSKGHYCIVWSKTSCTWIDRKGVPRDGAAPPPSDVEDPALFNSTHLLMENTDFIRLPEGSDPACLCIHRINRELVEVAPGEEISLAMFDDPVVEGRPDPFEALFDENGDIRLPDIYRGQRVTGTRYDAHITGPVQPFDEGIILRNPWPDELRRACDQVAGLRISDEMAEAAWRIIHPIDPGVVRYGVRQAA